MANPLPGSTATKCRVGKRSASSDGVASGCGDEAHAAGVALESEAVAVLVPMMVGAQAIEVGELRAALLLDRLVVVDLEVVGDIAAFDVALGVQLLDRRPQHER